MASKQAQQQEILATPEPTEPTEPAERDRGPGRSRRYRLFDDGTGDYRIYQVHSGDGGIPRGALIPLDAPGFASTVEAKKWIVNSGEKLIGMQIMVLRGMEIIRVEVAAKPTITFASKPRRQVAGPEPTRSRQGIL